MGLLCMQDYQSLHTVTKQAVRPHNTTFNTIKHNHNFLSKRLSRLCSVAELNWTQSNGLSLIRLDLFDWFGNQTHTNFSFLGGLITNSNHALSLIEFDWVRWTMLGVVSNKLTCSHIVTICMLIYIYCVTVNIFES